MSIHQFIRIVWAKLSTWRKKGMSLILRVKKKKQVLFRTDMKISTVMDRDI